MGKKYVRKSTRASFSEQALAEAMARVKSNQMGVNEASRSYGIASRTLRRHLSSNNTNIRLGRCPELGIEHERRLMLHIKALEKVGFAPNATSVKKMAYSFAENLGLNHRFSQEHKSAGDDWFKGFLRRNKELSIRRSEGLSLARAKGMNREEVKHFFTLLQQILTSHNLLDKPGKIFNVDETGIQINNKPGKVVATKGAKDVYSLTSAEKGENVSLVSCCSAEGYFLPPVLIFKGKYKKDEFKDDLPPGSGVFMNPKSSYISSALFLKWFEEYFLPKKGTGKALLILDGHSSHCNAIDLLDLAAANDVILLCLPSHTTQALQPLDRSFFKPLKTYFFQQARNWMIQNKSRKLSRTNISRLIGNAWGKAATVANAIAGFRACGIHPYNPQAIPEHFYSISDASLSSISTNQAATKAINSQPTQKSQLDEPSTSGCSRATTQATHSNAHQSSLNLGSDLDLPSTSGLSRKADYLEISPTTTRTALEEKETPSKFLQENNPIPLIPTEISKRKQHAVELTSPENRAKRRLVAEKKEKVGQTKKNSGKTISQNNKMDKKTKKNQNTRRKRKVLDCEPESESESEPPLSSSEELSDDTDDYCIVCRDYYYTTKSKAAWIKCVVCNHWLHETCTELNDKCNDCANNAKNV